MKKKIIFVTKALWIGGIETALINLLNQFDYDRFEVTLLVLHAELDLLDRVNPNCRVLVIDREKSVSFSEEYRHKRLYHLTEPTQNPSRKHRMLMRMVPFLKWLENWLFIRYVRRQMAGERFDTAIIYSDVVGEVAVRAIRADKFLMFYHHGAMRHVYHDAVAWDRCEKVIAVSETQAKSLQVFTPKYSDKIVAIHNIVDVAEILRKAKAPQTEPFPPDCYNIVTVGRVSWEKGMDLAVEACSKLVAKGQTDTRWWIIGDGPAMPDIQAKIERLGMRNYIRTPGMKSNPWPDILRADLYVQPSRFEGYPMTVLEALILGQPVLSTDNAGAREIIEDGVTGHLFAADPEAICEQILAWRHDPKRIREMRQHVGAMDFNAQNDRAISELYRLI